MSKEAKTAEVTATIVEVTKQSIVKTGERFLEVEIELKDGKKKVSYKRGYPLETTQKEIAADLKKLVATYQEEKTQAATQAEADKAEAGADATIEAVTGLQV